MDTNGTCPCISNQFLGPLDSCMMVVLTSPKSWFPAFLAKSAISEFEVIRTFGKLSMVLLVLRLYTARCPYLRGCLCIETNWLAIASIRTVESVLCIVDVLNPFVLTNPNLCVERVNSGVRVH